MFVGEKSLSQRLNNCEPMIVGQMSMDRMNLGQMDALFADQISFSQMTVSQMFVGKMCPSQIMYVMTVVKGL